MLEIIAHQSILAKTENFGALNAYGATDMEAFSFIIHYFENLKLNYKCKNKI